MMNKLEAEPRNPKEKAKCKHYWIIESPKGPTSRGVCKYCGAKKEFGNYTHHSSWDEDRSTPDELSSSTPLGSDNKSDA
jgi:hypothetical protein